MTPNEKEALAMLAPLKGDGDPAWMTPMEFGGRDGSHHGLTAKRMIPKGWTERVGGPGLGPRGSYRYRITPKGIAALANALALDRAARGK